MLKYIFDAFYKDSCIYLKGTVTEKRGRDTQGDLFSGLFPEWMWHLDLAKWEPGVWHSIWVFSLGCRGSSAWAFHCLPRHLNKGLDKLSSQDSNQLPDEGFQYLTHWPTILAPIPLLAKFTYTCSNFLLSN